MLEEDYNKYKNDTKSLLNLLENYVECGLSNEYTISDSSKIITPKKLNKMANENDKDEIGNEK